MLSIKNITKNYGDFCALKNITMDFENGVYGLVAPNGAGKTTLIKMLSTLIFPSEGEILYNGENILSLDEKYRSILGYLPQEFGYYKSYSPNKFLMYLAALKGMEKEEAKKKIKELLKLVALEEVADKKMRKFSGGMIQRVGIAQALLNNPKILILDEPTAGLDPKERARFRNLLSELSRDKIIIVSTHIVSDIESISNEIVMIKDKQLLYKDNIENICKKLHGKVFEAEVNNSEMLEFRKNYLTLSEKQENQKVKVRFICEEEYNKTWNLVYPSLEDVFLYEYKDEIVGV
ncbi:ATP-binding cassette domain-containing protein [Clostridium sp. CCUG 7971]|uniref:ATP-binding cassette domain-containing protein n=1 Tax=Clostridium sp. CCUG 7971 TaxID=2811414 RepID=UPI001ABA0BB0|nr:ATP-binding cassette domain-containing protein [Clostridium sp. CCUG 7971]MBO3445583.1 ATP-binding cassette domain-containing protein [Clostridium sp. CCUG 7971]